MNDGSLRLPIVFSTEDNDLARVHVGLLADGTLVEMVESVQPPIPRGEKWVLIVSTLKGCPIRCPICDAGGAYRGPLTSQEIVAQVDTLIATRYGGGMLPVKRLKVQFARTGEPALNDAVIEALEQLAVRPDIPGLFPSVSTVAPAGRDRFFDRLLAVKDGWFPDGRFQLQFSLHSTDEPTRRRLIPAQTWTFAQMASYGDRFVKKESDRKVTLNFAPARGLPLAASQIAGVFSPDRFLVKLTPINPTRAALRAGMAGLIEPYDAEGCRRIARGFEEVGYETIISIGELEENAIGSNCGMYLDRAARHVAMAATA